MAAAAAILETYFSAFSWAVSCDHLHRLDLVAESVNCWLEYLPRCTHAHSMNRFQLAGCSGPLFKVQQQDLAPHPIQYCVILEAFFTCNLQTNTSKVNNTAKLKKTQETQPTKLTHHHFLRHLARKKLDLFYSSWANIRAWQVGRNKNSENERTCLWTKVTHTWTSSEFIQYSQHYG